MLYVLILATALFGVVGDLLVNQWVKTEDPRWLVGSFPFWMATAAAFGLVLREKHYSLGIALIIILLIHAGLVLGWDILIEEAVMTPRRWAAVAAAIVAIVLFE